MSTPAIRVQPAAATALGGMLLPGIIEIPSELPWAMCDCGEYEALRDVITLQVCESNPTDPEIPYHHVVYGWRGDQRICANCLPQALADWALGVLVIRLR